MTSSSWRLGWVVLFVSLVSLGVGLHGPRHLAHADTPVTLAADELESQAADALRQGQFDRGSELFHQAAAVDPAAKPLATWAGDFEAQQQTFAAQRQKEFEKNVKDVHILMDHSMRTYAIDELREAYLRAADKTAFRHEKWVDDLVQGAAADARSAEANEQWLTALRIYSDLTSLDPSEPLWKQKLKLATRSIRLLLLYTPDQFKAIQNAEADARKAADALLNPTTRPSTEPTVAEDDNNDFKLDWHDTVRGISFDMLMDSLIYADRDYYRQVSVVNLMDGGIEALRTMATTQGLEKTFPNLSDPGKKKDFLWDLDQAEAQVKQINADNEETAVHDCLQTLLQGDHDSVDLPDEVFISEFADGALEQLDLFTSMIWPDDVAEFMQTTQGDFSGVGIEIQNSRDGNLQVVTPLEDSPADKAGIRAGDIIARIDGKNAHGITLNQAVKTITGPAGTSVVLTVRGIKGDTRTYTIERQRINVVSVKGYEHLPRPKGGWDYFIDPENKIAYIRLTSFTAKSGAELNDALDELKSQGARGLILDLRDNPGGLLNAAVEVASQFIREGVIVSTHPDRETENRPTVADAEPDDETTDIPLAVLVNQYSASASEIVSGALKDHHRATIVGERTFGKGSVQMLFPLANKSAFLKLTTSHYYLPSGRCLHREESSTVWGVDPDLTVEMTPEQMQTAIDARKEMEVLRDADAGSATPTTKPDMLTSDPQLSGALLVLRLKLAGVQI
jgi:carboxyl-terminal processing protease